MPSALHQAPHGFDDVVAAFAEDQTVGTAGRDHHAHPDVRIEPALDLVEALARAVRRGRPDAEPVQLGLHRLHTGDPGVRLGVRVARGRAGDDPPVVEHLRQVHDLAGQLGHPQREVVVLGALEPDVEAPHLVHQGRAHHRQVAGVHLAAQALRRPRRLAELLEDLAFPVDLVLVGVEVVGLGLRVDRLPHLGEGGGHEQVVVVRESDERAPGCPHAVVGGDDDVAVRLALDHPDPCVGVRRGAQGRAHRIVG